MSLPFLRARASAPWVILGLLLGFGPVLLQATPAESGVQAEAIPKGRYAFRSYGTQQGLNNLASSLLLQDRLGYVWVGTEDGLSRYDGQRFQTFDNRSGLPSTYISALHEDVRGTMWAGTFQGLARMEGRHFVAVSEAAGLPKVQIEDIASDRSNQIWVATPRGLFLSRNGQQWSLAPGWPGGEATAVLARPDTMKVWAAGWREAKGRREAIIQEWDGGQWRAFRRAGGLAIDRIDDLAEDPKGWVWARTRRELLTLAPGEQEFKPVNVPFSLAISARAAINLDQEGHLYLPTDSGFVYFADGLWQKLGLKEGLPVAWTRPVVFKA